MARIANPSKKKDERYQISIFLDPQDAEAVRAIATAKEIKLGSVIVNLMREGLQKEEYQKTIRAYQQFKDTVS